MQAMIVTVLDMDETLGVCLEDTFHVRPNVDFMIHMLRCMDSDIVLWSLGDDSYVQHVVNGYLPSVKEHAYKLFARTEAKVAYQRYGYSKAGEHIRDMYDQKIFLLGVDDQAHTNMNSAYDITIPIQPYRKPDRADRVLWHVCEKLVKAIGSVKLNKSIAQC